MSDRFWIDARVSVPRLHDASLGGWWNVHCDTLAVLEKVAEAARAVLETRTCGGEAAERLDEALAWLDFEREEV